MKKLELDLNSLQKIGQGGNGAVYKIDDEQIIKVYREGVSLEVIAAEKAKSKAAFVMGIPTAISFDVVEVGNCYGVIFELLNGQPISKVMNESYENFKEYSIKFAQIVKKLHSIEVPVDNDADIRDRKEIIKQVISTSRLISDNCKAAIGGFLDKVVQSDLRSCLHCDLHTNNIFVSNGELMFIDVGDLCYGDPVLDIVNLFKSYPLEPEKRKLSEGMVGLKAEYYPEFLQIFAQNYGGKIPPQEVSQPLALILILMHIDKPYVPEENKLALAGACENVFLRNQG